MSSFPSSWSTGTPRPSQETKTSARFFPSAMPGTFAWTVRQNGAGSRPSPPTTAHPWPVPLLFTTPWILQNRSTTCPDWPNRPAASLYKAFPPFLRKRLPKTPQWTRWNFQRYSTAMTCLHRLPLHLVCISRRKPPQRILPGQMWTLLWCWMDPRRMGPVFSPRARRPGWSSMTAWQWMLNQQKWHWVILLVRFYLIFHWCKVNWLNFDYF